jgi:uncharacterized protein
MISIEQARKLYHDDDPVHDFQHVLRVLTLAERLAQAEGADLEIVRTAALLHDISRLDDDHSGQFALSVEAEADHAVLAGREARRILSDADPDFVEAVVHAIEAHRFRNEIEPQTIEAKVLFDADKLDAIGAIGVARAFAYSGRHGLPLWGEVSADYVPGTSQERHTPHHEFIVKLKQIKDRLQTASGRQIAEARHRFMVAFFERMADEVAGRQ